MRVPLPRAPHPYDAARAVLGPSLRVCFPSQVEGLDQMPTRGPVVLAPNHVSIMDSIVLALIVPRRITFIAKSEHFDDWRSGWALRLTGQIKLQRGGGMAVGRALGAAAAVLRGDGVVGIYPEGTRSRDGRLHAGNSGPAWLAMATGAPIVPVGLVGTAAVHAPGEPLPHPFRTTTVRFGTPLGPPRRPVGDRAARDALTAELMAAIAGLSEQDLDDDVHAQTEGIRRRHATPQTFRSERTGPPAATAGRQDAQHVAGAQRHRRLVRQP